MTARYEAIQEAKHKGPSSAGMKRRQVHCAEIGSPCGIPSLEPDKAEKYLGRAGVWNSSCDVHICVREPGFELLAPSSAPDSSFPLICILRGSRGWLQSLGLPPTQET